MKLTIEEFTPDRAADVLTNYNNRNWRTKRRETHARRLAADMAQHRWRLTGDPIKFYEDGELADGQHRLWGCTMANVPFVTAVAYGVPEEATAVMDTGQLIRNMGDFLRKRGEVNVLQLAASIRMTIRWERDWLTSNFNPSVQEQLAWLDANPGIRDAVKAVQYGRHRLQIPASAYAPFAYRAQQMAPEEEVRFRHQLISGDSLKEGMGVYALRRWIENQWRQSPHPESVEYLAVLIKAWNAFVTGRFVRQVAWRRTAEPFPMMREPERVEAVV